MMIETARLSIRNFSRTDWSDLWEYLSLKQTYIYEPGTPINARQAQKMARERAKNNIFYAVELKESKKMIGHLYFPRLKPEHFRTWELGFIFNPCYHKQGFATEASKAIIDFYFQNLNAHRIIACCNMENIASWKLLEKIGMRREGHFIRKAYFKKDSQGNPLWFDSYQYAVLNDTGEKCST